MNDIFYYNWLFTRDKSDKYDGPIELVPLSPESKGEAEKGRPIAQPPGFWCRYINPLRNGNCLEQFTFKRDQKYTIESISDLDIISLYTCGDKLLAAHLGAWALYDPISLKKVAKGNWSGDGGSFYCIGANYLIFDNTLEEYETSGNLVNNTVVTLPPGMGMHEVARVNNVTIIDAFIAPHLFQDGMPKELRPCGFLQAVKGDEFTSPHGKLGLRNIEKSSTIAFVEDNVIIPAYIDSFIIQPITNGIVLFSYDLIIQRVLQGKFKPHFASAGAEGIVYLSAAMDDNERLMAISTAGRIIFSAEIPPGFGENVCPPMVSTDNSIYWIGSEGYVSFDQAGNRLMMNSYAAASAESVYTVLYNDMLAVSLGSQVLVYDAKGENIVNIGGFQGDITTPLISDGKGNYFVGTKKGLFSIRGI